MEGRPFWSHLIWLWKELEGILYASSSAWAFGAFEVHVQCAILGIPVAVPFGEHGAATWCCAELLSLEGACTVLLTSMACAVHGDPWQSDACILGTGTVATVSCITGYAKAPERSSRCLFPQGASSSAHSCLLTTCELKCTTEAGHAQAHAIDLSSIHSSAASQGLELLEAAILDSKGALQNTAANMRNTAVPVALFIRNPQVSRTTIHPCSPCAASCDTYRLA